MTELITTVTITASSVLLFGYWFRYTCLLILSAKTARDFAGEVAASKHLSFLEVQKQLQSETGELDRLKFELDRDYAVLTRLLDQSSTPDESRMERRMLAINYRMMSAWFGFTGRFSTSAARKALEEMSMVVAHFANVMGERAACGAAA